MTRRILTASSLAVKRMPPARTVLPSLITVPRQNPLKKPSSLRMILTASIVPTCFACCAFVFTVSKGCVASVVTVPATAPFAKVVTGESTLTPRVFSQSLMMEYEPRRKPVVPICFRVVVT